MPEETPQKIAEPKPAPKVKPAPAPPGKKWFKRIPKEILLSPGGVILIFFAAILEITDLLIPASLADSLIIEMILEIPFMVMLCFIAKIPFQSLIIPFLIERLPLISDIFPTWLIRMFI